MMRPCAEDYLNDIQPCAQGSPCHVAGAGHQQNAVVEIISQDGATNHVILPCSEIESETLMSSQQQACQQQMT